MSTGSADHLAGPPIGEPAGAPIATDAAERRRGVLAGFAAYSIWGTFPLVFHRLRDVGALEVLAHRITWSFLVVVGILVIRRDPTWLQILLRGGAERARLVAAAVCISINWLVYVWAVGQERVVEAALGYYINPLLTVALGVVVLREHLSRAQAAALVLAAVAVAVLTVSYGQVPWISLVLACSFAGYSYLKKAVSSTAVTSLAVETAILLPFAVAGLVVLEVRGDAAFLHGSTGQDLLLLSLGIITATPLLLFAASARRVPLVLLGLLQYLTPTLQLVLGVAVLHEELPPDRLAGFVLVWSALVVLGVDAGRRARSAGRRDVAPEQFATGAVAPEP
ncbi:MAG: EamA family transporter RarD [Actinobacteria bacterium]|nr:EamA family transporter RarD [Actinomycetota bacterium]